MKRVQSVQMVDVPPAPQPPKKRTRKPPVARSQILNEMKLTLEKAPSMVLVDGQYDGDGDPAKAMRAAYVAAYQLNRGERREWPNTHYYGLFRESQTEEGVWELLVGIKRHMPKEWEWFVAKAGSRTKRKRDVLEESGVLYEDEHGEAL